MKLSSNKAKTIIKDALGKTFSDQWIHHSIKVGDSAYKIANALGLDANHARTLGYVHDIGKITGDYEYHDMEGYKYLMELGYDKEYANVCMTHSYLNNDINCTAGGVPNPIPARISFLSEHKYTIYERIINICDLMCTDKVMTVDKRLIEIMLRRGVYPNTQYHIKETHKLKEFFDQKLGYNLYSLFRNIEY